jgi:hypothetical protein
MNRIIRCEGLVSFFDAATVETFVAPNGKEITVNFGKSKEVNNEEPLPSQD